MKFCFTQSDIPSVEKYTNDINDPNQSRYRRSLIVESFPRFYDSGSHLFITEINFLWFLSLVFYLPSKNELEMKS